MESFEKTLFAALFGILYLASGLIMILSAFVPYLAEQTAPYLIPPDPAAGFVLCVVGMVLLFAYRRLAKGTSEGHAFLCVGMALSVVFGIVAFLSLLAQGAGLLLFGAGESWNPVQLLVPMVYLAIVPAFGLFFCGCGFMNNLTGA
jgi:hypothetical protein